MRIKFVSFLKSFSFDLMEIVKIALFCVILSEYNFFFWVNRNARIIVSYKIVESSNFRHIETRSTELRPESVNNDRLSLRIDILDKLIILPYYSGLFFVVFVKVSIFYM